MGILGSLSMCFAWMKENATVEKMKARKVQEVLHMNEGFGETSYAKNSQVQVIPSPSLAFIS